MGLKGGNGSSTGVVVGLMILLVLVPAAAAHLVARWLGPESAVPHLEVSAEH